MSAKYQHTINPADIRALIGCETSGEVLKTFLARDFDAYSCDLLPADDGRNRHFQDDIRTVIAECGPWDFMAVMHPPGPVIPACAGCTIRRTAKRSSKSGRISMRVTISVRF